MTNLPKSHKLSDSMLEKRVKKSTQCGIRFLVMAVTKSTVYATPKIMQKIYSLLTQLEPLEKNCILQWIPAHVGIGGNDMADELAKERTNINDTRTYRTCNNCPGMELTPTHIFSCPAMATALQKIDMDSEQQLYTPKIEDIAVIEKYGDI
ncbi:hypothetical protein LAZ67_3005279 [Cordylochernes scorpioides]|uniref:RNase H type-1 domain-containing protein n=1 Tax=Cordylochernes scorpioides TaxID=51811 RepID=A0ABY6KDL7_9ARAC|nr:hypothetical protein LAZ67_3005279 [Cordylochernes scorpioides]